MRLPIKPLCEQKILRSDGTSLIYFQFFHEGEYRTFLNSEGDLKTYSNFGKMWKQEREPYLLESIRTGFLPSIE